MQDKSNFMIEKIKERPVNRRKLMRRTLITAAMAVIFGLIACFTFLVLEPIISNWLYPEEDPQIVLFPEDQEEMSPEEMLSDTMQNLQSAQMQAQAQAQAQEKEEKPKPEDVVIDKEQVEEILDSVVLDKKNYVEIYDVLSDYVEELSQSMVTVTSTTSDVDWLNNVMESSNQVPGVIVANNNIELLILSHYSSLKKAEKMVVTFYDGTPAAAVIKQYDEKTNMAILAVSLSELEEGFIETVQIAQLGSTLYTSLIGDPVIALGSPMGSNGSIGYGIIAGESQILDVDSEYKLLQTDIYGSSKAGGVLFNMQGKIIGMIVNNKSGSDMKNLISAYGISDLRKLIEKMSNATPIPYLGIKGIDVSKEANLELKVPFGAYVKEVPMNSPAMLAGIQQGDVIVKIGKSTISDFEDYEDALMKLKAGETVEVVLMRQSQEEYKEMMITITLGKSGKED